MTPMHDSIDTSPTSQDTFTLVYLGILPALRDTGMSEIRVWRAASVLHKIYRMQVQGGMGTWRDSYKWVHLTISEWLNVQLPDVWTGKRSFQRDMDAFIANYLIHRRPGLHTTHYRVDCAEIAALCARAGRDTPFWVLELEAATTNSEGTPMPLMNPLRDSRNGHRRESSRNGWGLKMVTGF